MQDWITVFTTPDAMKIALAQSLLEAEGVPTFFKGEAMGSIGQMYGGAMGLHELQVLLGDEGRARQVLIQADLLRILPIPEPDWLERFDTATRHIPVLGKLPGVIRLFLPIALLILLMLSLVLAFGNSWKIF